MAQSKYTLYKYVRISGYWRYCRAALYANHMVKRDVVLVGDKEEKHTEGNYYLYHAGRWVPAGPDASAAQRQQHALLSGNVIEYERTAGRPMPKQREPQPQSQQRNSERKKIKGDIDAYLDNLVLSKRPAKTVRMKRNFLIAFAALIGKEHADEYRREDVLIFRNSLVAQKCEPKYVETQMMTVVTFFNRWLRIHLGMEKGDWPVYKANPPEPYSPDEIRAMEKSAKGKMNLLLRLFRSTGCRNLEIAHLRDEDIDPQSKTINIRSKPCSDCADCRARGGIWTPKTEKGQREIPVSDGLLAELLSLPQGLLFPDKRGKVDGHLLRQMQRAVKGSGVQHVKLHRFRDTFAVNKLRDGVDVRTLQIWLGHESVEQVMDYCAWLDSQSDAARKHANKEETRYSVAAD
jgi:integrase